MYLRYCVTNIIPVSCWLLESISGSLLASQLWLLLMHCTHVGEQGKGTDKKVWILGTVGALLWALFMDGQIQTTCFELAFIKDTLPAAGELRTTGTLEILE